MVVMPRGSKRQRELSDSENDEDEDYFDDNPDEPEVEATEEAPVYEHLLAFSFNKEILVSYYHFFRIEIFFSLLFFR